MAVLPNFPMVSQLSGVTSDGQISENAAFDCVPASIGAVILWLQGKKQWDSQINPDHFKDVADGQGAIGGTAAVDYISYCKSLGFHLYSMDTSSADQSVSESHTLLAQNKAVIFTEKDPYVPASYGWSHVCVFYADGNGTLTAMDPYIARPVTKSDAEWAQVLLANQLWLVEEIDSMAIDINSPGVGNYFAELDTHHWTCKSNSKVLQFGVLDFYKQQGGLQRLGLPVSNEIPLDANGNTRQHFERGVVFYDPQHVYDRPPGAGNVYYAHVYQGPAWDAATKDLNTQISTLASQLQQAQASTQNNPALAALKQVAAIVDPFK